jgi:diaminopimelate epimerase
MSDFYKYHGLGNDYLVVEPGGKFEPSAAAVRAVCDRHFGVGSDGILLGPAGKGPFGVRIFNPDGGEAEKSGNGLRIFAWFLYERGLVGVEPFTLDTLAGPVLARIVDPAAGVVQVDMGAPDFAARGMAPEAGLDEILDRHFGFGAERCRITVVSMGNPHCVILGQPVTAEVARRLGPVVETAPIFPKRINVQFVEVLSRSALRIEIWERGAGYTLASGSSSCAAAAAARRLGLVDDQVEVRMPGGVLRVTFAGGSAHLVGPVAKVMEGVFAPELLVGLDQG